MAGISGIMRLWFACDIWRYYKFVLIDWLIDWLIYIRPPMLCYFTLSSKHTWRQTDRHTDSAVVITQMLGDVCVAASMHRTRATLSVTPTTTLHHRLRPSPVHMSPTRRLRGPRSARRASPRPASLRLLRTSSPACCRRVRRPTSARRNTGARPAVVRGWSSTSAGRGSKHSDELSTGSRRRC